MDNKVKDILKILVKFFLNLCRSRPCPMVIMMMAINVPPKLKCQIVSWFVKLYFGWCEIFDPKLMIFNFANHLLWDRKNNQIKWWYDYFMFAILVGKHNFFPKIQGNVQRVQNCLSNQHIIWCSMCKHGTNLHYGVICWFVRINLNNNLVFG